MEIRSERGRANTRGCFHSILHISKSKLTWRATSLNSYQLLCGASIVAGGEASAVSLRLQHTFTLRAQFRRRVEQLDRNLKHHQFSGGFCVISSAPLNIYEKAMEF